MFRKVYECKVWAYIYIHIYTHIYICIYKYIYLRVHVPQKGQGLEPDVSKNYLVRKRIECSVRCRSVRVNPSAGCPEDQQGDFIL